MAVEIGLLSVTQIQNLSQSQHHQNQPKPNPSSTTSHTVSSSSSTTTTYWMWNPREHQEEDDSWEVRAFAEDTRNVMGTTWPPRSYTCTFCRREFRSAQALGGHMNVHRRDRARLHQPHPAPAPAPASPNPTSHYYPHPTSSFINIPPQELVANGSLCLLYHLPSPNAPFSTHSHSHTTNTLNACAASPSTLLPVSSYPPNNLMVTPTCSPSFDFPVAEAAGINGFSSYPCSSVKVEEPTNSSTNHGHHEELDLELRLGNRSTPS